MAKKKNGNNEGSIRKRKNGQWEGRYTIGYDSHGKQKQVSVYGKTRAEVAKKINEKVSAIQNGTYIVPRDLTLSEWLNIWLTSYAYIKVRPSRRSQPENHSQHVQYAARSLAAGGD